VLASSSNYCNPMGRKYASYTVIDELECLYICLFDLMASQWACNQHVPLAHLPAKLVHLHLKQPVIEFGYLDLPIAYVC